MTTHDIVEAWTKEAEKRGTARSLVYLYEGRFGAMPGDLRAAVENTQDEATLHAWILMAATRDPDDVAAAIRAFHAS